MNEPSDEVERIRRQRDARLWRMLLRAQAAHAAEVTARIHAAGFRDMQPGWPRVLGFLDTEGTRLGVLAERARVTRQAASQMVNDIERAGYVRRVPDPDDRRGTIVQFTPAGRRMLATAIEAMLAVEATYEAAMGAEAWNDLCRGLGALLRVIDTHGDFAR